MANAVTRELKITYGAMVVGGATNYQIWGPWKLTPLGYRVASVEFMVLIAETTEAAFAAARIAVENAFSTPRQRLKVELGSSTLRDLDPATNTGFDAEAEIRDDGPLEDTGRSRLYKVRIVVALPAGLAGQNGLAESEIELSLSPSKVRRVVVTGTYTAVTGPVEAQANFEARFAAYVAAKITGQLGAGTFELVDKQTTTNDTNKWCKFRVVYDEVIFSQSAGTLDNPQLFQPSINITRREGQAQGPAFVDVPAEAKGGGTQAKPLEGTPSEFEVEITYDVSVDKAVTDLNGLWLGTVKPFLLTVISSYAIGGVSVIETADPGIDPVRSRISARVAAKVYRGGNLISFSIRTTDDLEVGDSILETHGKDRFSAYVYEGRAKLVRTIRRTSMVFGTPDDPKLTKFFEGRSTPSEGWILLRRTPEREPRFIGLFGNYKDVYQLDEVFVMRWITKPSKSSGGGTRSR